MEEAGGDDMTEAEREFMTGNPKKEAGGDDMTEAEREFMTGNPEKKFAANEEQTMGDKEMNDVD